MDFTPYTLYATRYTFYFYISPWFLEKTLKNIQYQIPKFKVVSYMYPIKILSTKAIITEGKNSIFTYNF
jgi:hypothetical protein